MMGFDDFPLQVLSVRSSLLITFIYDHVVSLNKIVRSMLIY